MKHLILLFSLTLIGFGCAKKDNNNNNTTPIYTLSINGICTDQNGAQVGYQLCQGAYYSPTGQCLSSATGQPVDPTACQYAGSGNGQYSCVMTYNGTPVQNQLCLTGNTSQYSCVVTATRQPVAPTLCQSTGYNTGYGITTRQCYGAFRYPMNGQIYQCGIQVNCQGQLMTDVQTGQQVQCL